VEEEERSGWHNMAKAIPTIQSKDARRVWLRRWHGNYGFPVCISRREEDKQKGRATPETCDAGLFLDHMRVVVC
jgi:hypothetical protein